MWAKGNLPFSPHGLHPPPSQTSPFLFFSSHRLFQMMMKPCAQRGWRVGYWASTPMSANNSFGQSMAFSVPINIPFTALSGPGSKGLHWHSKVFHPQTDPGGDTKGNRKPRASPEKLPRTKQGKAQNRKMGLGVRAAHAGSRDSQQSRSPTPGTPTFQQRHLSPPSQGMPVDTASKGHAPGQSPRTPQPSTSEPVGMEWSQKYFSKNHFPPERLKTRW